jgi:signal transduction histidine kinase/CheY-like chemotaxis protein/HPt (histidine-containing phosphotransfer) domain-containing protein
MSTDNQQVDERATTLYRDHYKTIASRTDRIFVGLLAGQWAFGIIIALLLSPRTWDGLESRVHPHVLYALVLGGLIAVPPSIVALVRPGAALSRYAIAVAQMAMGALLIHLTGGRIETHFHVFGSLAFLAFYRDYRVILVATIIVVLDHVARGVLWPESVYGVASIQPLRWFEHAGWVVFEDVFLISACVRGQREIRTIAKRHAVLESKQEVEVRMAEAREASRAKSEFLANMSHEIRTPMTAIIGYADLLLDPETTANERVTHIQTIRRNGEHLLSILNDILDLSKIEAGKMTVETVSCSPSMIIIDVASLMRVRAKSKNLFFEVQYLTPIPDTIESDPTRLRQVLMNLVGNALKFTVTGGIRILVSCNRTADGKWRLTVEVVDTGIGMTAEQIAQIFQPFAQADASTTRKFGGTGLGLAICQRLAHMLGGDITVDSSLGRGSSFRVVVDAGNLEGVEMLEELHEAGIPESGSEPIASSTTKALTCKVLLAEDGVDNQLLISTHLSRAGARVTVAENGRIAADMAMAALLAGDPFDVILMDMQMPEMDGYAATSELRRKGYKAPIVALTAHAMAGDRERCLAAGCTDYLTKPISRAKLVDAVASHAADAVPRGVPLAAVGSLHALPTTATPVSPLLSEMDDPDMQELIAKFVGSVKQHATTLESALRADDRETVRRTAHQLKGAAGGYGFPTITSAAQRLESAAREGEPLAQKVAELADLCRRAAPNTVKAA